MDERQPDVRVLFVYPFQQIQGLPAAFTRLQLTNQPATMKKNLMKTFLHCGLGLMAAVGILSCNSARATLLWEANSADGTSVFNGLDIDESGGTVTVVGDPLGQFGNVYQFYLPDEA